MRLVCLPPHALASLRTDCPLRIAPQKDASLRTAQFKTSGHHTEASHGDSL